MSLDTYMVLALFFLSKLGANSIADLRDWQELEDNPGAGEQTVFFERALEVATPDLASLLPDYDRRLRIYEERLSNRRKDFTSFKYFQYLALLATEYHLHRLTTEPEAYLADLNIFLQNKKVEGKVDAGITPFSLPELRHLAFYLATGAGKTLLLHVHYWQVQHYLEHGDHPEALVPIGSFNNILLLVPNAGLADQHIEDLIQSGIPTRYLTEVKHNPASVLPGTVLVVDMPKLRQERAKDEAEAEGIYYPMLGRANLVFVDEGHKGTRNGDGAWRKIREYLSAEGFMLEYSATFEQVLSTQTQRQEYGKRILADYKYRYFYYDGYGKDFEPINVDPSELQDDEYEDATLIGGLLLYYRQLELYIHNTESLKVYNIEKPLWVFVGHTVTRAAKGKMGEVEEDEATLTDVAKVVRFLKRFLEEREWAQDLLYRAIHAQEYIGNTNPFAVHLQNFQNTNKIEDLYDQIRENVFGGKGTLELHLLPAKGEIGLRVSAAKAGQYFGLIRIGDTTGFRKLIEQQLKLQVEENPLFAEVDEKGSIRERSLFREINRPWSYVNLLIGSRAFREGWSSWRVSTMTLLYIGQGEGPEIIQLFGRGIRLLGREHSLKRSDETWIRPLETLYILGLKANYMEYFLKTIEKERIPKSLEFPIDHNEEALKKPLPLPRLPQDFDFSKLTISLHAANEYAPLVVLAPKVKMVEREDGLKFATLEGGERRLLSADELRILNWPRIVARLHSYARNAGYRNLNLQTTELRNVLERGCYKLIAFEGDLRSPKRIEVAALTILRRYLDRFYRTKLNEAQTQTMKLHSLQSMELPKVYIITTIVDSEVFSILQALKANLSQWRTSAPTPLPRLYLDPSLIVAVYQPLIYETKKTKLPESVQVKPTPLKESEYKFIRDLENFWKAHHDRYPTITLYLMRNPSKTGLGFYHKTGFYPDFILWVEKSSGWRVVFVEPHGMRNESVEDNPKLEVFIDLLPKLNTRDEFRKARIELDGYVLTTTSPNDIPGASTYFPDWDRLAREKHLLVEARGTEANLRTICGL